MENTPQNALIDTPTDSNCQRIANAHTIRNRSFFHNLYNESTAGFRESQGLFYLILLGIDVFLHYTPGNPAVRTRPSTVPKP
jgi:hypothetical protein